MDYSDYVKQRILFYWRLGKSYCTTNHLLLGHRGYCTTKADCEETAMILWKPGSGQYSLWIRTGVCIETMVLSILPRTGVNTDLGTYMKLGIWCSNFLILVSNLHVHVYIRVWCVYLSIHIACTYVHHWTWLCKKRHWTMLQWIGICTYVRTACTDTVRLSSYKSRYKVHSKLIHLPYFLHMYSRYTLHITVGISTDVIGQMWLPLTKMLCLAVKMGDALIIVFLQKKLP